LDDQKDENTADHVDDANTERRDAEAPTPPAKPRSRLRRLVTSVVRIVVVVYVAFAALLYGCQSRFIYAPRKEMEGTPEDFRMPFEEVSLHTSDGVKLAAWFVPAEEGKERGVLLFCHGNAGNMSHRIDTIFLYRQMGLSVLIFDYRGYGLSEGSPSEEGTYCDARAAWDYLTQERGVDPSRIVVFGRSLGGAIAGRLASEKHPGAAILESTFTSVPDLGAKLYPFLPVRLLSRFSYNTLELVGELGCPLLVIHSEDDQMIPFSQGEALYNAAAMPKQFLKIHGGHNEGYFLSEREYTRAVRAFLEESLQSP
jgi:uncharacterized protein